MSESTVIRPYEDFARIVAVVLNGGSPGDRLLYQLCILIFVGTTLSESPEDDTKRKEPVTLIGVIPTLILLELPQERLNCDVIPNDAVRAAQTRPVLSVRRNGTTTAQDVRDLGPTYGWPGSPDDRMRSI